MIGTIILCLLGLVLLVFLYRVMHTERPKVIVNPNGKVAGYVAQMKESSHYKPTPWLLEGNTMTIYGMRYRGQSPMKYRRELFEFEDKGTAALDWFEPENAKDTAPIVVVIHTLAGGSREPCSSRLCAACTKKGWRAVVANNRICSGAPVTSRRFYNAILIDDIQAIIAHIRKVFKPSHVFLTGFSLGGYQAIQYNIMDGNVDGVAIISHTYDSVQAANELCKPVKKQLYNDFMMAKLKHLLKKVEAFNHKANEEEGITDEEMDKNFKDAQKATCLQEFDDAYTCKVIGLKNWEDYYQRLKIYDKIPQLKAPTLIVASDDDPFTRKEFMPVKEVEQSDNCVMVRVSNGGHVSFCEGMNGKQSFQDRVVPEWFSIIMNSNK